MESGDEFVTYDSALKGSYLSDWCSDTIYNLLFADTFIQNSESSATERRHEVLSRVTEAVKDLQNRILEAEKEEDKLLLKFLAGFAFYRLCLLSELDRQTFCDFSKKISDNLASFARYQASVEESLAASLRVESERMQRVLGAGCSDQFLYVYDSFAKYQRGLLGLATLLKFYAERAGTASISEKILADYDQLLRLSRVFSDEAAEAAPAEIKEEEKEEEIDEVDHPKVKWHRFRSGGFNDSSNGQRHRNRKQKETEEKEKEDEASACNIEIDDCSPVSSLRLKRRFLWPPDRRGPFRVSGLALLPGQPEKYRGIFDSDSE